MCKAIKYNLFFLWICSIVYFNGCSSSTETEREKEEIRYEERSERVVKNLDIIEREYISSSKISSIEKINLNLNSEDKIVDSKKLSKLNYNTEGFLTETIIYNEDGSVKFRFIYDYDNDGRRIKTSRFSDGKLVNNYIYEYNEHGNKSKAVSFNTKEKLEEYYLYEYDYEGNLIEEEWYSSTDKIVYSIENDYENGLKKRSQTYDENGDMIFEYVFRYDEKENIVEEIIYDKSGLQTGIIQYIYKYF